MVFSGSLQHIHANVGIIMAIYFDLKLAVNFLPTKCFTSKTELVYTLQKWVNSKHSSQL